MATQATVIAFHRTTGLLGMELGNGSCVLAEHLHGAVPQLGQTLSGEMATFGEATWVDTRSGEEIAVFVQAYDIARDAVELAMR